MRKYSVIIPVYNRPVEVDELLESLTEQTYKNFEVLVIEDGSSDKCEDIVEKYKERLDVTYYFKENTGQGFTRNYGFERATGDYFIVFDSDCIIPKHYFQALENFFNHKPLDAFGGPDKAHPGFNDLQKAISYSMTSFFTTGGIRGNKKHIGPYHPRSFNMGISKEVFKATEGYIIPRMGEDIEFSIRINKKGFKTGLIPDAYVYHKRRTSFKQFWDQLYFFGRARINIARFYPEELKLVHLLPLLFLIFVIGVLFSLIMSPLLFVLGIILIAIWSLAILIDSALKNRSLKVGILSVGAAFIQLSAYASGFFKEALLYKKSPFEAAKGK
ncbi:MAG: glycosyltransferase [Candidatus Cyclobacteriaceae bacterium M2_1C_046]